MNAQRPAVVLLSGGLDSATTLAVARRDGFACHALSFDYGQRHAAELLAAAAVAEHLGVASHTTLRLDPAGFTGSALTDARSAVPKDRHEAAMSEGVPITYVPARNTIFLGYALAAPKSSARRTCTSGSTRWITRATPTAGRRSSTPSSVWPTSPRGRVSRVMPTARCGSTPR